MTTGLGDVYFVLVLWVFCFLVFASPLDFQRMYWLCVTCFIDLLDYCGHGGVPAGFGGWGKWRPVEVTCCSARNTT